MNQAESDLAGSWPVGLSSFISMNYHHCVLEVYNGNIVCYEIWDMRGNHCKFPILLFSQCCVLCCCYFITATWWNVSPLPGNNRCLSEPLKHFPSLRGLKGPGPGLPEVKIKHLSNEENLLLSASPSYRERERARHRVISGWNLLSGDNQYPASYAMRQRQDVSHDCLGNVCCKYSPIHYIPQQIW